MDTRQGYGGGAVAAAATAIEAANRAHVRIRHHARVCVHYNHKAQAYILVGAQVRIHRGTALHRWVVVGIASNLICDASWSRRPATNAGAGGSPDQDGAPKFSLHDGDSNSRA
jgi:hypothetical protein